MAGYRVRYPRTDAPDEWLCRDVVLRMWELRNEEADAHVFSTEWDAEATMESFGDPLGLGVRPVVEPWGSHPFGVDTERRVLLRHRRVRRVYAERPVDGHPHHLTASPVIDEDWREGTEIRLTVETPAVGGEPPMTMNLLPGHIMDRAGRVVGATAERRPPPLSVHTVGGPVEEFQPMRAWSCAPVAFEAGHRLATWECGRIGVERIKPRLPPLPVYPPSRGVIAKTIEEFKERASGALAEKVIRDVLERRGFEVDEERFDEMRAIADTPVSEPASRAPTHQKGLLAAEYPPEALADAGRVMRGE